MNNLIYIVLYTNLILFIQAFEELQLLRKYSFNIRPIFLIQILAFMFSLLFLITLNPWFVILSCVLFIIAKLYLRHQMQTPICGGSDNMLMLILTSYTLGLILYELNIQFWIAPILYLGVQAFLSYFVAGIVKVRHHTWRSGEALSSILTESHYPIPPRLKSYLAKFGKRKKIYKKFFLVTCWLVIIFELSILIALFNPRYLIVYFLIAIIFHFINWLLFGLHRFLWTWPASYPAIWIFSQWLIEKSHLTF